MSSETRGSDDSNAGVLMSSPSLSGTGDRPRPVQPPSCQSTASQDPSLPQSGQGIPGTTYIPFGSVQMPPPSGQAQMPFMPVAPTSGLGNYWSEQAFNAFIDSRIRLMTQQNISTRAVPLDTTTPGESVTADSGRLSSHRRFNRFERESRSVARSVSPDVLDLADAGDDEFHEDDDQSLDDSRSHCNDKCDDMDSVIAPNEGTGVWKNFITKLASELKVPLEAGKPEQEYASYVSEHLQCSKESSKID